MTTIQKLPGHQQLNSTMIYARVHDHTVAEDYYAAMEVVEKRLAISPPEMEDIAEPAINDNEHAYLLELATQLAEPEVRIEVRLDLVEKMCEVLNHSTPPEKRQPMRNKSGRRSRAPP